MIHRTFRSLDDPPKLLGFSVRQWVALIAATSAVLALVYVTDLPTKVAITLLVFTIGLPAALMYVSESGGLQLGGLLCDAWRWRVSSHTLPPASPQSSSSPRLLVAGPRSASAGAARARAVSAPRDEPGRWG